VYLDFNLNEDVTTVTAKLAMTPNHKAGGAPPPLVLNGRKDVKLVSVKVAGERAGVGGEREREGDEKRDRGAEEQRGRVKGGRAAACSHGAGDSRSSLTRPLRAPLVPSPPQASPSTRPASP
jgi:hypothetical protein